jgi:hypothetical protein
MKLEFELREDDFLIFQLFTSSTSPRIIRKKKNGWTFLTLGTILFAFLFYSFGNAFLAIYMATFAVITALFYPKYFKWRYKRHYENFIKDNYANRLGLMQTLEFHPDHIFLKDKTGESKINLKEIEEMTEISSHFFIKLSSGVSLIVPKDRVNSDEVRAKIKSLDLKINDLSHWKW